jgi:hypothetical protein
VSIIDRVQQRKEFYNMIADRRGLGMENNNHMVADIVHLYFHVLVGKRADAMLPSLNHKMVKLATQTRSQL